MLSEETLNTFIIVKKLRKMRTRIHNLTVESVYICKGSFVRKKQVFDQRELDIAVRNSNRNICLDGHRLFCRFFCE